jgi:hypothetical protein
LPAIILAAVINPTPGTIMPTTASDSHNATTKIATKIYAGFCDRKIRIESIILIVE